MKLSELLVLPWKWPAVVQIEDLIRIQEFPEAVDQLQSLASTRLHINENQERLDALRHHARFYGWQQKNEQLLLLILRFSQSIERSDLRHMEIILKLNSQKLFQTHSFRSVFVGNDERAVLVVNWTTARELVL